MSEKSRRSLKPAESIIVDHEEFKNAIVSSILKVVELRGRIASALMFAGKKAEKCMEGLRLHIKSLRAVSTLKAYKTGKIMIPARSQKLETRSVPGRLHGHARWCYDLPAQQLCCASTQQELHTESFLDGWKDA